MFDGWNTYIFSSAEKFFSVLLPLLKQKDFWVFRGSNKIYTTLYSSFDRPILDKLKTRPIPREICVLLEEQIINNFDILFEKRPVSDVSNLLQKNITTLMLMQHYGCHTRLVDWSTDPRIAAFFAVSKEEFDNVDGEIYCFNHQRYLDQGDQQWHHFPEMLDGMEKFKDYLEPSFDITYNNDWIVCQDLYKYRFPNIIAQNGLFTFSPQFGTDHAQKIRQLLDNNEYHKIYIVKKEIKKEVRKILHESYGISHSSVFPNFPQFTYIETIAKITDNLFLDSVNLLFDSE